MESRREFVINVLYYAAIFGLVYLFCNYLLGIFGPFILGFIIAYFAVRVAKKFFRKESKLNRIISLIILYVIIALIFALLIILGINEISDFISTIPSLYKQYVEPVLENFGGNFNSNSNLPASVQSDFYDLYNSILDSIKTIISSFSASFVKSGSSIISGTTGAIVGVLTTIITSFFVASDYEKIIWYFESLLSPKTKKLYDQVKDFMFNTVFSVIKCYAIIMFITFIELVIGLGILGVDNFPLLAMIISVLDILPVLGVGTVLIPWALFELITKNYFLGIGLVILYLIITVIRNIIEPKFVGNSLDIHPLATLFTMLLGLNLFGFIGMFGLPLFVSFMVKHNKSLI